MLNEDQLSEQACEYLEFDVKRRRDDKVAKACHSKEKKNSRIVRLYPFL